MNHMHIPQNEAKIATDQHAIEDTQISQSKVTRRAMIQKLVGVGIASACLGGSFLACSTPGGSASTISGKLTDSQGKPITNAELTIKSRDLGGQNYQVNVGSDGTYSQQVEAGVYVCQAYVRFDYNNDSWKLPLYPTDGSETASNGSVKDFVWKLSGLKPGQDKNSSSSYYGAALTIGVNWQTDAGCKYQIILTPNGSLADGSTGQALTTTLAVDNNGGYVEGSPVLSDIPLGVYTISATGTDANGNAVNPIFQPSQITYHPGTLDGIDTGATTSLYNGQ